ncbi:hypothetical protein P8452_34177 [Trifolium repens]|nr:hypothetical protein P8452_34171 [Trifolium repens]WJX47499.1 hypothetical protein P8452_34177 [Trifolium repens]
MILFLFYRLDADPSLESCVPRVHELIVYHGVRSRHVAALARVHSFTVCVTALDHRLLQTINGVFNLVFSHLLLLGFVGGIERQSFSDLGSYPSSCIGLNNDLGSLHRAIMLPCSSIS